MAILPFRGMAEKGILHDPSPYQLDLDAFSDGSGVRFHGNKAMRAPVMRSVYETLTDSPAFCASHSPATGYDSVFIAGTSGRVFSYSNGVNTEITPTGQVIAIAVTNAGGNYVSTVPTVTLAAPPAGGTQATAVALMTGNAVSGFRLTNQGSGYLTHPAVTFSAPPGGGSPALATAVIFTAVADPRSYTATYLGDVTYLNRPSGPPVFYGPSSTSLEGLPDWDGAWSARSVRAFSDYLIALNVTKGSQPNPSLVKWSDLTLDGLPPASWNANDPTTSAGENPLEQLTTPIVDGLVMRNVFVIYSEDQVWAMAADGSEFIFNFTRLFGDGGMMAPNCAVEVDGQHYVFGPTDIYRHDGNTKQSLIDGRNRDYVYRNLSVAYNEACFVLYMPKYKEIMFGYNSGDTNCVYPCATPANPTGATLANKAAIYSIPGDTWAFVDLPNVGGACLSTLNHTLTYETAGFSTPSPAKTYANIGGSYFDQDNVFDPNVVLVSAALDSKLTNSRLLAYDFFDKGSLAFPFSPEANGPVYLERTGIDLDQVGSDLTTYKMIRRMYPLVTIFESVPIQIQIGGSNTPSGAVVWGPLITFDPSTQYKIDMRIGGRYLGVRFKIDAPVDFEIAGFDLDVSSAGRR